MKRGIAIAAAALLATSRFAACADDRDIVADASLRDAGYMLGDLLEERIDVTLPGALTIDPESLPLPGRVAPWLEVRHAELGPRRATGQTLVVTYQIFAESEQAARVPLPELHLRARAGDAVRAIAVPSRSFLLSPGLPPTLTDRDRELAPSPAPAHIAESASLASACACLLLALASAMYLLWRYDRLPFLPRSPGPLVRAWRRWRHGVTSEQHVALLRDMHQAFSGSAGETLYPSTLDRLFDRAPHLVPLRARIAELFAASWRAFYEEGREPPSAASVLALLREAADRERGVPC